MSPFRILFFEDNADYADLIVSAFQAHAADFRLDVFDNRKDLMEAVENEDEFDLVLYSLSNENETGTEILDHPCVRDRKPLVFLCDPMDEKKGVDLVKRGALEYISNSSANIYNLPTSILRLMREWGNVVARRQAEAQLLESESKYRRVTEYIHDVVWEMDASMKVFSFISDSVFRFLGYSSGEFLQLPPTAIIHPGSLKILGQARQEIIRRLRASEPAEQIQFLKEVPFVHKNGQIRWGEVRGFLVVDEKQHIVAVSGIVRDITEQKETRKNLEIQEAFFETLIREAPLAIVILDNSDRIKQVNNHFLHLFGYTESDCLGKPVNDLIVPDDLKEEGNYLTQKAAMGEYISHETIRRTKTGKPVDVEIIGKPVILNNRKLGVFGLYQDISQRKKVEVATRVAKIKQQFLANMSHEIRSPMTGILGMIDLLKNTTLNAQQLFFVDVIKKSSDGLLNIVNDILDLSKIEAGKLIIRPAHYHFRTSAENIFSLFNALASQKGLDFYLDFDAQLPEYIFADENRVSQIVTNLLSNAIKFTSHGTVRLKYELIEQKGQECLIRISVCDSGIGIGDDDKEKLFKIFSQIDTSDTRNFEGTGLGLSISERLAELMHAKIDVTSKLGKGSTFSLTFKATSEAKHVPASEPMDDLNETGNSDLGYNVLLTEDKRTNQMVISLMLEDSGCIVEIAENGQEALEKIAPGKYDFVFMDIQMPVMDGLTAVRELRKKYASHELPFIIGLSAKAMEGDAEYYIAKGMDDYLTKPVTTQILHNCMVKWKYRKNVNGSN